MKTLVSKIEYLNENTQGYWSDRILSQMKYAIKLSEINNGKFDDIIAATADFLFDQHREEYCITKSIATQAEEMLKPLSEKAKAYKIICAAHAHIDMNWMWGYPETVGITLDTFRTMLDLMNEYPDYKFSQSQASVYKIAEEFDPDLLAEIKKRVKEGRWEITASTWVETDKNMPNGESLARHILYTKKYLSTLFDLDPDDLAIDFEPDTFGHNLNVPEILQNGGVKYYYHCRGYDKHYVYKWKSPAGSDILVYREPLWYNADIESSMGAYALEFCSNHQIDTFLKVYGVGDHGGGPTRKDIEKIIDMQSWSVFPTIRFGTFAEYFKLLEGISENLPIEDKELNFIFSGCYTSQSRIKMANRIGEARLSESEAFSAINAAFADGKYNHKSFESAWRNILFNHFHDILPGSGVIDTREHAMGLFQQALANANTEQSKALRNIATKIDTSSLIVTEEDVMQSKSEGAGVGFGIERFRMPQTERGRGKTRIFHVFNPAPYVRSEAVELVVWDWNIKEDCIEVKDSEGNTVDFQVLPNEKHLHGDSRYWGHKFLKLVVDAKVPAYGYTTYVLGEKEVTDLKIAPILKLDDFIIDGSSNPRVDTIDEYVLENEYIKAVFDPCELSIIALTDKKTGQEMVTPSNPAGIFRYIKEDDAKGMTSWTVGRYLDTYSLNAKQHCKIKEKHLSKNALMQCLVYEITFNQSKLTVKVSLDRNGTELHYDVTCDWQERAVKGDYMPQLNFYVPTAYTSKQYKYDIPFGSIERKPMHMDVPANSFMAGMPSNGGNGLMLVTDSKYGFRGIDNAMAVTLIRSSYDPDPYPEFGIHNFKLAIGIADTTNNQALIKQAYNFCYPISFVSANVHKGELPLTSSFISLTSDTVALSAVKIPENVSSTSSEATKMIVRGYETAGKKAPCTLTFAKEVKKAYFMDINEKVISSDNGISCDGKVVTFEVDASSIFTIGIEV